MPAETQDESDMRGVRNWWVNVNHIAIVVADIGTSLAFYTDVVGFEQVMRPDFDRHGAWLTMGNVDLHLIKGRPAVHSDDDLIVSHIALTVTGDRMETLREKLADMGVRYRNNVSVPNPTVTSGSRKGQTDQAFVRDPDGYYIEFCSCESLEDYLKQIMADNSSIASKDEWGVGTMTGMMSISGKLKQRSHDASAAVRQVRQRLEELDTQDGGAEIKHPDWLIPDEEISEEEIDETAAKADPVKLRNLLKRRKTYGDITQNATDLQIQRLLVRHDNEVPKVIASLEEWVQTKRTQTYIPPAFYDKEGQLIQPPSFEMPAYVKRNQNAWNLNK
ncbi:uncharacterized protein LOC134840348 [Symsagittifera roscoffensis]|uniref:uncharacterized protein LOC134840348 n=1 Tax=Symsagittifera roscoffensis TaxID=84072 RepID=UPI00307C66EE